MTSTLYLTSDKVGVEWLKSLSIFPELTDFANYLPSTQDDQAKQHHDLTRWTGSDFVTIVTVGGDVDLHSPEYSPVFQVDCWSKGRSTNAQPPWYRANQLAESIRHLQYSMATPPLVTVGGNYPNARVQDVSMVSEPRRVPNDPLGLAHYTFDLQITFTPEELEA